MRTRYQVSLGVVLVLVLAFSQWEMQKSYGRRGRYHTTGENLAETSRALQAFDRDVGRYPNSAEGLGALLKQPNGVANWKGPYIRSEQLLDAWGHQFVYRQPARPCCVAGYGRCGTPQPGRFGGGYNSGKNPHPVRGRVREVLAE